jgi:hypothetical protein
MMNAAGMGPDETRQGAAAMKRIMIIGLMALLLGLLPAAAQEGNLLQDPGFEGPYVNRGRPDLNTPAAWPLWAAAPGGQEWQNRSDKIFAFPHITGPQVLSFPASLNINGGFVTFNAAVYQQVAVPRRANLQGSVFAWIQTCNSRDANNNFIGFPCGSSAASETFVRVGIDPNGGTDVGAQAIVWGPWIAPHDRWEQATVNGTSNGELVTFFIQTIQGWPADFNNRWFDNASLTVGGPGGTSPGGGGTTGTSATPAPRPTSSIPARQPAQPDGSIVHVVQAGDTLSGISIAYGVPVAMILQLNDLTPADTRRIRVGQRLLIATP